MKTLPSHYITCDLNPDSGEISLVYIWSTGIGYAVSPDLVPSRMMLELNRLFCAHGTCILRATGYSSSSSAVSFILAFVAVAEFADEYYESSCSKRRWLRNTRTYSTLSAGEYPIVRLHDSELKCLSYDIKFDNTSLTLSGGV